MLSFQTIFFFKIHVRVFSFIHIYMCCKGPPGQTKNGTDLKFGTHTPLDYIYKWFFIRFFEKVTLRAFSLGKLVCHMDFPPISCVVKTC